MRSRSGHRLAAVVASLVIAGSASASWTTGPARAGAEPHMAFTVDGEAGAWVGGGVPQVFTDADAAFVVHELTTPGYLLFRINGTSGPSAGVEYWVRFAAPPGEDLAVGTYTGATRADFRAPGEPGIDIAGDHRGCGSVAGAFTVHEVEFSGPSLTTFSATYSFTCDGLRPTVAGEMRYGSTQPFAGLRQVPPDPNALSFAFGSIVGVPSDPRSTTLVNVGSTTIALSGFVFTGDHPGDFARTAQTCGTSLAPGASCSWDTTFIPTAGGTRLAQANYKTNTYGFVHGQLLAGHADEAIPYLRISPGDGRNFGTTVIGAPASQAFTVTSGGNVPVEMGARSVTGPNAADFRIASDNCPGELIPDDSCTVTVAFDPLTDGTKTAALEIASSALSGPHVLPLSGTAVRRTSGVTWSSLRKPGPANTWTYGGTLGRTVRSGAQRLHLAYATDRINGTWARNSGPYAGIYYVRSGGGSTWTTPKRINPSTQHSIRPASTAAGSRVYVAWVSQTKIFNFSPTAPRVLYVRVNTKHGDGAAWKPRIRLTSTSGRVDYPSIAAAGEDVAVAWTNSVTGTINVAVSRDRGVAWKKVAIGSTSVSGPSGYIGLPSVAISGATIAVSWVADMTGTVRVRVSADRGASFASAQTIGSQSNGFSGVAVRGSRLAVVWATPTNVVVRVRSAGTWGPPRIAGSIPPDEEAGAYPYAPVVTLQDPNRVAVAWSEQLPGDDPAVNQRWTESADNGVRWFRIQTLATMGSSGFRVNDFASVLWPSASTRIVVWSGWTPGTTKYRQLLRIGSGAPTTAVPAIVWSPDPGLEDDPTVVLGTLEALQPGETSTEVGVRARRE